MRRTECLSCKSKTLIPIIQLGVHPFSDTFIGEERLEESEPVLPLECHLCQKCGHIQTGYESDAVKRYNDYDYSYTSSNSGIARAHWEEYALTVTEKLSLKPESILVEIGSNDGYLCNQFKSIGMNVSGVDAAKAMVDISNENDIDVIHGCFDLNMADHMTAADVVLANNVFNHSNDPLDFAKGVASVLVENGTFVCEQPYWATSVETQRFDQIYHEHVSYFTITGLQNLLGKAGLYIYDAEIVDYHGGSLRIYAGKKKVRSPYSVREFKAQEEAMGLFEPSTYDSFMQSILSRRNSFLQKIYTLKTMGHNIVAVGAAAKGNTFLNFYNLDSSVIDYVTDCSEYKQGKYTPLSRILITGDEILEKYKGVYVLILSWNLSSKLKEIIYNINPKAIIMDMDGITE
jgi:SAM-dependent methyltransferase